MGVARHATPERQACRASSTRVAFALLLGVLLPAFSWGQPPTLSTSAREAGARSPSSEEAPPWSSLSVLALAPLERRTVVRSGAGGELQVVEAGETLDASGTALVLLDVLPDRIVVEETGVAGRLPRRVWIWKPEAPGKAPRVVVIDREPPDPPLVRSTELVPLDEPPPKKEQRPPDDPGGR